MARQKTFRAPRDRRTKKQRERDRVAADKQASRAADRCGNADLIAAQTARVVSDRAARRSADPESTLKLLEPLQRGARIALVVVGERLVRVDGDNIDELRSLVAAGRAHWVEHLEDRLVVVHGDRASDAAHYAVPFGPVMKAAVGAEPASPLRAVAAPTSAPAAETTTEAVPVAVIDTGIAGSIRNDGWLAGVRETDANRDPRDALPPDNRLDLGAGHGTFVAGIIEQVAPGAEVRMYRGLDSDGIGSEESVASAMVLAAKQGAAILCLSLGLQTLDDTAPVGLQVATEVVRERWPQIVIVAAAGNFGDDHRPCWPAALKGVVSVGGLDRTMQLATWSSRGPWVDCSTIGEAVHSTFVEGTERDDVDPDPLADVYPANAWAVWSGTSFAAPQVAAAIAQLAMANGVGARDALALLLQGLPDEPDSGRKVTILPPTI